MIKGFRGKMPRIAESACISDMASVIGDVEIGEDSSVWPGAVVRADYGGVVLGGEMKIGNNVHIEDNVVIHCTKSMGNNIIIGHGAVVEATTIGSNVLIGDNAAVLMNSEIGSYCVIGAGAVVKEGMKIPDRSFVVGMPAVVKKQLSAEEMEKVKTDPDYIKELAKEYGKEGF